MEHEHWTRISQTLRLLSPTLPIEWPQARPYLFFYRTISPFIFIRLRDGMMRRKKNAGQMVLLLVAVALLSSIFTISTVTNSRSLHINYIARAQPLVLSHNNNIFN